MSRQQVLSFPARQTAPAVSAQRPDKWARVGDIMPFNGRLYGQVCRFSAIAITSLWHLALQDGHSDLSDTPSRPRFLSQLNDSDPRWDEGCSKTSSGPDTLVKAGITKHVTKFPELNLIVEYASKKQLRLNRADYSQGASSCSMKASHDSFANLIEKRIMKP